MLRKNKTHTHTGTPTCRSFMTITQRKKSRKFDRVLTGLNITMLSKYLMPVYPSDTGSQSGGNTTLQNLPFDLRLVMQLINITDSVLYKPLGGNDTKP